MIYLECELACMWFSFGSAVPNDVALPFPPHSGLIDVNEEATFFSHNVVVCLNMA